MPHGIYIKEHAEMNLPLSGQKWRPANGFEGEIFIESWCYSCAAGIGGTCPILEATFRHKVTDAEYPSEWQYGEDGQPKCTAFEALKRTRAVGQIGGTEKAA